MTVFILIDDNGGPVRVLGVYPTEELAKTASAKVRPYFMGSNGTKIEPKDLDLHGCCTSCGATNVHAYCGYCE